MVKGSWSQGHYVEQHSRAKLQLRTIYNCCVRCKRELVTRTLRRAGLTSRTTSMYTERARRFGLTSTHLTTLSRISTLSLGSHLHSSRSARGSVATAPQACRRCAHPCGTSCERVPAPWVQILERRSMLQPSPRQLLLSSL